MSNVRICIYPEGKSSPKPRAYIYLFMPFAIGFGRTELVWSNGLAFIINVSFSIAVS